MKVNNTESSIQKSRVLQNAMRNSKLKSSSVTATTTGRNSIFNSIKGNININNTQNTSKYSTALKNNYLAVKSTADSIQSHVKKLLESGDTSLFGQAIQKTKTVDTTKTASNQDTTVAKDAQATGQKLWTEEELAKGKENVLKEISGLVDDFNSIMKKMATVGGTNNKIYIKQMKGILKQSEVALKEMGVTQGKDGTLVVDQKQLQAADMEKAKKIFGTKGGFADLVSTQSLTVEAYADKKLFKLDQSAYSFKYNQSGNSYSSDTYSGNIFNKKG